MVHRRLLGIFMILKLLSSVGGEYYLNSFNKLTHIPKEIPYDVKKIYLNNNQIADIESDTFAENSQCVKLRLDYNKLSAVRNDMWTGLVSLQYLSLEHNAIEFIKPSAFADLPNLKGLYLHSNKLAILSANIFRLKHVPTLEVLTLHGNNLRRKELGWLQELCDREKIQQYTIQGDEISCTNYSEEFQQEQHQPQPKENAHRHNVIQLEHNTQVDPVSDSEVEAANTTTASTTLILISAGGAMIVILTGLIVLWRCRVLKPAGEKATNIDQGKENGSNTLTYKPLAVQKSLECEIQMDEYLQS